MYRYIRKIHPDMKGSVIFGEPGREGTTVQQPPTLPTTGGLLSSILLIALLVVVAVSLLGWAVKRRSS
jgi:LPXTG cell wall anchor motif